MSAPLIDKYIDALWMEKGLSENTLASYRRDLGQFAEWLQKKHKTDLLGADKNQLQAHLGWRLQQGRSARSTARLLSCLRGFYRYQLRENVIGKDPTLDIESPKLGRPLPKSISEAEVKLSRT